MTQNGLRQMVVVELGVALECVVRILMRATAGGRQNVADAPIEALYHPVCLRKTQLDERDAESTIFAIFPPKKSCLPAAFLLLRLSSHLASELLEV